MKQGQTPIHIMRWAPVDYHEDEWVKLLKRRRAYKVLTFYRHFLDYSYLAGGDLPSDPQHLAAVVEMPCQDVRDALTFCLGRLIEQDGDRLFQKRVRRDVLKELKFRDVQREHGKTGGRPTKKDTLLGSKSPPAPSPSPAPTPITDLSPNLSPPDGGKRDHHEADPDQPEWDAENGNGSRATGTNPRGHGTNSRALGTNPRALGTNPIALGTNPRATRSGQVEALVRVWLRLANGQVQDHPPLDARDKIKAALRSGRPFWQIAGSISEQVRESLVAVGKLAPDAKWPPDGWLEDAHSEAPP